MAKFSGKIGIQKEVTVNGRTTKSISEVLVRGDLMNFRNDFEGDKINNDITYGGTISIIAPTSINRIIHQIRYVVIWGVKWKVTGVKFQHPRIVLSLGGVYNG